MQDLDLHAGYWLERDADILVLHRSDDSIVAAFSAQGADPSEIERVAEEDHHAATRGELISPLLAKLQSHERIAVHSGLVS